MQRGANETEADDRLVDDLERFYGEGGNAPTREQWRRVLRSERTQPVGVVNLMKLRDQADYGAGVPFEAGSALEALMRYAAVSRTRIAAVGGRLVLQGLVEEGAFIGSDEHWDVAVVAEYPSREAFLRLFRDELYRDAYRHRRAAVERYRAFLLAPV